MPPIDSGCGLGTEDLLPCLQYGAVYTLGEAVNYAGDLLEDDQAKAMTGNGNGNGKVLEYTYSYLSRITQLRLTSLPSSNPPLLLLCRAGIITGYDRLIH